MLLFQDNEEPIIEDPFYESQENHSLIGVANIFLEVLFHDVKLDYAVPVISQQGEVGYELFAGSTSSKNWPLSSEVHSLKNVEKLFNYS